MTNPSDADRYVWLLANMGTVTRIANDWNPRIHMPLLMWMQGAIDEEMRKDGTTKSWIEAQRNILNRGGK